jgi:serine phosphatase RsbU (regulator of sigma subunit)
MGLPILLLVQFRRGNREAGLLILPSLLPAAAQALGDIGTAAVPLGLPGPASLAELSFSLGRVRILVVDLSDMGFLLAIGALLVFRFTRISHQQARAAAELEAAQRVQSLLLRRTQSEASYAQIDVVYRPAQEVGGDFFHIAQIDGATRVVVGDVSGKGMGAAMLVSVLVGALDSISDADPVAVLDRLNAIMLVRQQGGFATCLCALVSANGELTLANAGQLAPYRNGEEVQLQPGLPLGITASAEYSETSLELAPRDSLTFLSDGVVEAQSLSGELFGFDRTAAISSQSAEQIAAKAQVFGQQDDITVLTLTYVPAEVLHA